MYSRGPSAVLDTCMISEGLFSVELEKCIVRACDRGSLSGYNSCGHPKQHESAEHVRDLCNWHSELSEVVEAESARHDVVNPGLSHEHRQVARARLSALRVEETQEQMIPLALDAAPEEYELAPNRNGESGQPHPEALAQEFLQTRSISTTEVQQELSHWKGSIQEELDSIFIFTTPLRERLGTKSRNGNHGVMKSNLSQARESSRDNVEMVGERRALWHAETFAKLESLEPRVKMQQTKFAKRMKPVWHVNRCTREPKMCWHCVCPGPLVRWT